MGGNFPASFPGDGKDGGMGGAGSGGGILLSAQMVSIMGSINNSGGRSTANGGVLKVLYGCNGLALSGTLITLPSGPVTSVLPDTVPPVITCSANISLNADSGRCSKSNVTYSVSATDNCTAAPTVFCVPPSGSTFNVGTTNVNCTAQDAAGNQRSCSFTVSIRDAFAPVITCPANIILECVSPAGQPVSFDITAVDPCDPNVTAICVPPSGSVFSIGPRVVNCTATDPWGNQSSCSFTVLQIAQASCSGSFPIVPATSLAGEVTRLPLSSTYPCGDCVNVTGTAANGWSFMGWLGDARGTTNPYTITMTQTKCVEGVFGTTQTVGPTNNGTARLEPIAPLYPYASTNRILARPNPGFYFAHWTNGLTGSANPGNFNVAVTNAVITPVFLPLAMGEFSLAVEVVGQGRVRGKLATTNTTALPLLNRYAANSNVVLTAVPDPGQDFLGWTYSPPGTNTPTLSTNTTVLMMTNRVVFANFSKRPVIEIVRCQDKLIAGLFRMKVKGSLQEKYEIQASPGLGGTALWTPVGRGTNVLGAVQFEDPYVPGVSQRFYRAVLVP